jgi:hypothetical protein
VAHPKHEQVRQRYGLHCGYCGVAEEDVGGELTVDHYVPLSAGGDETDGNLVYACHRCNLYKGDFRSNEEDIRFGRLVLHPLRDDSESHFRRNSRTGLLEPLTVTVRFHIALLHLNRPALVALRLRRRRDVLRAAKIELLAAENRELRAILDGQRELLERLKRLLQSPDVE